MSSRIIRPGEGTAGREPSPMSWPVLGGGYAPATAAPAAGVARGGGGAMQETASRDLEREIAARVEQAHQAGMREGMDRGRQEGAAQWRGALERLARSVEEMSGLKHSLRKQAEGDVVQLSMTIARRILYRELAVDPEALLGLVRSALDRLDARELHRIRLHPQDAPLVAQSLDRMGLPRKVEVAADGGLERGAAIFETSRGALDGSIDTQLEEIGRGFSDILHRHRS